MDLTHVNTILPSSFLANIKGSDIDPLVRAVYTALYKYAGSAARQKWLEQRRQCKQATFENEFFTEDEKKEAALHGEVLMVVNKLVLGVQGTSAIATANRPDIKVFPLRESDPYLAELTKSGLEHVWLKNFGSDTVYDMVEERNVGGVGCISGMIDPDKGPFGAVTFEEDDPKLWYWSDESKKRDRSDTHLIKAQLRSYDYIRDNYPSIPEKDLLSISDNVQSTDDPDAVEDTKTGKDNYKFGTKGGEPDANTKKRQIWEIEAWMLRTEREHWAVAVLESGEQIVVRFADAKSKAEAIVEMDRIESDGLTLTPDTPDIPPVPVTSITYWPRKLKNRYKTIVVGKVLVPQPDPDSPDVEVKEARNPLGLDSDGDPVLPVVFYFAQRTRKAYHRGPAYYAYDSNKSLCKREAQYTLAISKSLSSPVVREEQGTRWQDPERPDRPGNELLISKSSRMPDRLNPPVLDLAALTARVTEDKTNIDEAFGLPEVLRGKVPQGLERMSGRLGLALQDTGTIMQNPAIRGLESALERLGKLLLSLMLKSWTPDKWQALVTEDRVNEFRPPQDPMNRVPDENKGDEMKEQEREERRQKWSAAIQKVTSQGMSIVDFNIAITAGSSLPTNRLLKEETAIEKFKIGLYDREAALEYSGDPHAKEIAARIDNREMQMAQMGAKPKKG